MLKSNTNGRSITSDETLRLKNVTSLNVANYSDVDLTVTMDDIPEIVKAFDPTNGFPYIFEIKGDGTSSDIEMKLEFDTTGGRTKSGNAVLRYKKLITNENC